MAQPGDVQRILRVCEQGDESALQLLLDAGWRVNVQDENGITPLQVAAANNHFLLVSFLIYNGSDIDASNSSGWAPIHHACFHGHNETIQVLLKSKASKSLLNKYGASPLSVAVASGHNTTVKLLLDAGCEVDEGKDKALPILSAAAYGYPSIMRQLLSNQKESSIRRMVNTVDKLLNWSPILMASALDSKPTVQYLLERGANPDYQNRHNLSALDIATVLNHTEIVAYLQGKTSIQANNSYSTRGTESDFNELLSACKFGDNSAVDKILETRMGLDVNGVDSLGASPLMYAALKGEVDIISKLVHKGAKVDFQDAANGWTALMQAVFYGHGDAVRQLLKLGADPTIPDRNGLTAFDLATLIEENDTELIRWSKVGKRLHVFSQDDFPLSTDTNGHSPFTQHDFGFLTQPRVARQHKVFLAGCHNLETLSKPPPLKLDRIRSNNIPEGVTTYDAKKFLPLINTNILLRRKTFQETMMPRKTISPTKESKNSKKLRAKSTLRPTHFSDFRPRTKSPVANKKKVQRKSKEQPKDLHFILQQLFLEKYMDNFLKHEIDYAAFLELTDSDLQEIGIEKTRPRKQLLEQIQKLKAESLKQQH